MSDMAAIIQPKSDQLNADSLAAGPITIKVRKVELHAGQEQPCVVYYEGDDGKPYKPCKSMARLMVQAWKADSAQYVGKSMTLYRDPKVKWAGMEVGGIRISHMSHIDRDMVVSLTSSKGNYKPYKVQPLKAEAVPLKVVKPEPTDDAEPFDWTGFTGIVDRALKNAIDPDALTTWWNDLKTTRLEARAADKTKAGEIATRVAAKIAELTADLEGA